MQKLPSPPPKRDPSRVAQRSAHADVGMLAHLHAGIPNHLISGGRLRHIGHQAGAGDRAVLDGTVDTAVDPC